MVCVDLVSSGARHRLTGPFIGLPTGHVLDGFKGRDPGATVPLT